MSLSPREKIQFQTTHLARSLIRKVLLKYFKKISKKKRFCIISNDCWGGEIYKVLNRPFNTPFIGLMLMSPCYIKLLENPQIYVTLPLVFKKKSKYPSMQKINAGTDFPLAVLGDSGIEIQFLHYRTEEIAKAKWDRRVKRMDWDNLFVKYDCGKDYADKELVERFLSFSFPNKLIFGQDNFDKKEVYILKNYSLDALVQFRNSFLSFDPVGWLIGKAEIKNAFQRCVCNCASKYV